MNSASTTIETSPADIETANEALAGLAGEVEAQVPLDNEMPSEEPSLALLEIGSPAPPLSIDQWVMGTPVDSFKTGQVYVVEFWATWCGPCRTSMPHLSSLQAKYGESVQIMGVTSEAAEVVSQFLETAQSQEKTWSEAITYRLAVDANRATNNAYMRAARQSGIPTAFIVGSDGFIEWIGHPMSMDRPLAQVVAGSWNREVAAKELKVKQQLRELELALIPLQRTGKWDEALQKLDEMAEKLGPSAALLNARLNLLLPADRLEEASQVRSELVELAWDDPSVLNDFAWNIAIGKDHRDLELAHRAAVRAVEITDESDANILDTLARVLYEKGELDDAITWQRKAVEHGQGRAEIERALQKYLSEQKTL